MEDEKQRMEKKRSDWDMRPYLAIGALIFLVFCCCIAVFVVLFKYSEIKSVLGTLGGVMQPIFIGAVLGYLFNPLMRRIEGGLAGLMMPKAKNVQKMKRLIRTIASILTMLVFVALLGFVIYLIIPALGESIVNLVSTMSTNVDHFIEWYENLSLTKGEPLVWEKYLLEATDAVEEWFNDTLVPQLKGGQLQDYVMSITMGAINVVVVLKNVVIGLIVSIYVLMEKERFEGQTKKMIFAILPTKQANGVIQIIHKVDEIFGGFIIGKIIDSIIIGILCFIGCSILRMPYTLLVSVIIGITNVIPFFGPLIGAIPCLIIVTITDPLHGLYLLIFVLALQQVDGNIIGPKILGDSTGLSSFWVMFAIIVGGGLFGFMGMLFGVPTFAVIYYLIQRFIAYLLDRRGLPSKTTDYTMVTHVDPESKKLCTDAWSRGEGFRFASKKKSDKKKK